MRKVDHPLYNTWNLMHQRCKNPNMNNYANYGGRGIRVCERWFDFYAFVEDVGEKPEGCTMDRPDNDGDYGPDNFQWANRTQQSQNRRQRKDCVLVEIDGITKNATDWAALAGVSIQVFLWRLKNGWHGSKLLKPAGNSGPKSQGTPPNPVSPVLP